MFGLLIWFVDLVCWFGWFGWFVGMVSWLVGKLVGLVCWFGWVGLVWLVYGNTRVCACVVEF